MVQNPNWPRFRADWSATGHIGYGASAPSYDDLPWVDVTARTITRWGTGRGRQYETTEIQAGSLNSAWDNRDGAFDPSNGASVYAPGVLPYQPHRIRGQWPGVVNLLGYDQATAGQGTPYPPGLSAGLFGITNDLGFAVPVTASGTAYTGTQVYQVSVPISSGAGTTVLLAAGQPVTPGVSYAASAQVRINTSGQNISTAVAIQWRTPAGVLTATTAGTATVITGGSATWIALSAAGPAPQGAATATLKVEIATGATTGTTVYQVGALQWEAGVTAASAFATPGTPPTNILTLDQATSGEGTPWGPGASPSMFGLDLTATTVSEWQVVASATAVQGTQVCECTITAAAGSQQFYTRTPATPLQAYSYTAHARCLTSGQNPTAQAQILWYSPTGTLLSTSNGSVSTLTGSAGAPFTTLTVSGTAPAGAGYAQIGTALPAGATAAKLQCDALQWEANTAPSAWVAPHPWYPVLTGGVERYPQSWTASGTFGKSAPTSTDAFALLSQSQLPDVLTAAIFTPAGGSAPSFAYELGDPGGSGQFADTTGTRQFAQVVNSKYGAGTVTPGTAQTAATPAGMFLGAPNATVTNFTAPATGVVTGAMSALALPPGAPGAYGPGGGTGLGFTRMIAIRPTADPSTGSIVWISENNIVASGQTTEQIGILIQPPLTVVPGVVDANHFGSIGVTGTALSIDNWHLVFFGIAADGSQFLWGVDSSIALSSTPTADFAFPSAFKTDYVAAGAYAGNPNYLSENFTGDMCYYVEWPFLMTAAQATAVYNAWRTAYSGDTSGQRYARILAYAGWTGPTAIDTGSSLNLGPIAWTGAAAVATNLSSLSPVATVAATDALTALQQVVDTEAGLHYVDGAGRLVFKARSSRYDTASPVFTFGENYTGGEWPYESVSFDSDPTLICNLAQVTQQTTSQILSGQNTASQNAYGTRLRQITNLSNSASECQDQANYVANRYAQPIQRVQSIMLHPSAQPQLWPVCLALELNTLVQVNRRPFGAPMISFKGWVEKISWDVNANAADAKVTLQLSPVDATPYGQFTAMHATLHAQASSGQAAAVLSPLPDSATNSFSCYVFAGMQMTLDPGTALSETLTVSSVSATSAGYTSVTVTFTTNLANTHASGATACEALPALSSTTYAANGYSYTPPGQTNPATWDTSVFGAVNFAY